MLRNTLSAFPDVVSLTEAVSATDGQIALSDTKDIEYLGIKSLIQIDNEVMKVIDVPEEALNVRVQRGYMGTTKAAHAAGAEIKIFPSWGWTDYEFVNYLLPLAYKFLKPLFWTVVTSDTFTWTVSTLSTAVPTGSGISDPDGNVILRILFLDSDGLYKEMSGWRLVGSTIFFRSAATSTLTLKCEYLKFQGALSSDSSTLDSDDAAEPLVMYMASLAFNALKTNRARFAEYSASLNDRASTADELVRIAYDLRNQAIVARDDRGRPFPSRYASTWRPPR